MLVVRELLLVSYFAVVGLLLLIIIAFFSL